MADGRELEVWNAHARECEEEKRTPFEFDSISSSDTDVVYPYVPDPKKLWLRKILLSLENVTDVLDIGCGPCYWINLFEGFRYHGFDQSLDMIKLGQKQLATNNLLGHMVELRRGNARTLKESYLETKFDLVFTSAVLQHNRHVPDKTEIVQGMYDILRPGGYYLCTEDTCREDNHPECVGFEGCNRGPEYTFKEEGWRKFMIELGFETLEYRHPSEYLYRRS